MSFYLWKYFLEDDVDAFRQFLARATYANNASKNATASPASHTFKIGSPSTLATSPRTPTKPRKIAGNPTHSGTGKGVGPVITRADINARDGSGRTILHHAATSTQQNAAEFVHALLEVPMIDLYIQDSENGWTALHRALYAGNIDIAQAILTRDVLNATDFSSQSRQVGGLVKIKDHEGNSPFEVFSLTIAPRDISNTDLDAAYDASNDDDANSIDVREDGQDGDRALKQLRPHVDLHGDEAFAFGSNKNLSLGLGDEDDRQFPERIHLVRPEHLLWRLYEDHKSFRRQHANPEDLVNSVMSLHLSEELPAMIKYRPFKIQDIVMAKLHTAILTDDPISNLHICGFGAGGRLGTGDETTRFNYVCVQGGGLASRRVSSIALGQDHCVVICTSGEVFTWGSNKYGQLGYVLPEVPSKEIPMQLLPRQLYGLVKKETIIGAAASSIHSVIFTANGLYTFGKNEGQLGLMDADARSLQIQDIPRRVGVSLLQSQIRAVCAIDRATTVLLENRDVIVFTHYGFTRVLFPLEESNIFLSQALPTRYSKEANMICKISGGSNTIGALSTFGQVFTIDVPRSPEAVPSSVSTTNPNKARNALPTPSRVWSLKKAHMSAADVAIGQDGSIILCTAAGAVWKKEKRANIKSVHAKGSEGSRTKDYKFVRVPHLTKAIAVRSNAFGAFTAVRQDCDVTREQIYISPSSLLTHLFPLLSFHNYAGPRSADEDEKAAVPKPRFWTAPKKEPSPVLIKAAILKNPTVAEEDFVHLSKRFEPLSETSYDVWVKSSVTEVRIPAHATVLKARSRVLRSCLAEFHEKYYFAIPEVMSIEYGQSGEVEITFQGADFLTLVNFVLYLYTENVIDVWHHTSRALHLAPRYRQVRIELMKIASHLELRSLERAVRVMIDPSSCIMEDFEIAYMDLDFYSNADVMVDLANGAERPAHSVVLSSRCPFFEGLFHGRAAGLWLSSRKDAGAGTPKATHVDLKHIDADTFDLVLRHIYADTADELFDNIISKDLDEFIDTVIEVLSVANELMLDRLVQVCQSVIGKSVTPRNICGLLNAVAESSVDEFKIAALEYLCLNLEGMLEQRLLSDLDAYLVEELNEVVQDNQLAFMPFVRSDGAQNQLFERHPDLVEQLDVSRQRRVDSMKLHTRLVEEDSRSTTKIRVGSFEKLGSSPIFARKSSILLREDPSPRPSPAIMPNDGGEDLPFNMDEDSGIYTSSTNGTIAATSSQTEEKKGEHIPASSANGDVDPFDPPTPIHAMTSPLTPSESHVSGFEISKGAWKQSALNEDRTDLRQIMEQASVARVSNLTQAMKASETLTTPVYKMSQRERKRQQQQSKIQPEMEPSRATSEGPSTPQTPWTNVTTQGRPSLTSILSEPSKSVAPLQTQQRPNPSTRQSVPVLPHPEKADGPSPQPQQRSASIPITAQADASSGLRVQSIRHTPLPTRSTSFVNAHTSMADILAQQQGEKVAIKEAIAARSLQDIQQEQEFQEWWDQESKRLREEEEARTDSTAQRTNKAGRGRGNRRRGSGRGGTTSTPKERGQAEQIQPSQPHVSSEDEPAHGDVDGRGRGNGRARGRGRAKSRQDQAARATK